MQHLQETNHSTKVVVVFTVVRCSLIPSALKILIELSVFVFPKLQCVQMMVFDRQISVLEIPRLLPQKQRQVDRTFFLLFYFERQMYW